MALSSNIWNPVLGGPGIGRLLMAVFGESEEPGQPHLPFLTFTIQDGGSRVREVKVVFTGIGFDRPSLDFFRKVYQINGNLWAIDGVALEGMMPSLFPVTVNHYVPDRQDKGHAALKISDSVGHDLEVLFAS
ncbi:MAG TPA: hypothetical protein VLF88_01200 [Candidatus Babeliales bacterium]|nr:hypothetical protein [Candidatus Babeliales bacterium]